MNSKNMNVCKLLHGVNIVNIVSVVLSAGLTATFSIAASPGIYKPCDEFVAKLPNMAARLQPSTPLDTEMRQMWLDLQCWTVKHLGQSQQLPLRPA